MFNKCNDRPGCNYYPKCPDNCNGMNFLKNIISENEYKTVKEIEYHKNCHDCGQFLKKDRWIRKDDPQKSHGLCNECFNEYDTVY